MISTLSRRPGNLLIENNLKPQVHLTHLLTHTSIAMIFPKSNCLERKLMSNLMLNVRKKILLYLLFYPKILLRIVVLEIRDQLIIHKSRINIQITIISIAIDHLQPIILFNLKLIKISKTQVQSKCFKISIQTQELLEIMNDHKSILLHEQVSLLGGKEMWETTCLELQIIQAIT